MGAPGPAGLERPLKIRGVGHGTQDAKWMAKLPIAVPDPSQDNFAVNHTLEAPVVEGPGGEGLPAPLELKSISARSGVIETVTGSQKLSFPGPGGYEIKWSPGTQHFELKSAPSGHMVIPLGDFSKVANPGGGVVPEPRIFHATLEVQPSGANCSSDPAPTS